MRATSPPFFFLRAIRTHFQKTPSHFLPSNIFFYSISLFPKENFSFSYQKNLPLSFLRNFGDLHSKIYGNPFPHAPKSQEI